MEKSLWHKNYFRKMDLNIVIKEQRTANRRLAKKRVQRLIEHSTSYQILCLVDSLVLRNPLLRQAPNRCAKVSAPLQLLHIEARITSAAVSKRFRCRKNLQHICVLAKFPQESKLSEEISPIRASLSAI